MCQIAQVLSSKEMGVICIEILVNGSVGVLMVPQGPQLKGNPDGLGGPKRTGWPETLRGREQMNASHNLTSPH